ncbi:MAG: fibronectin type III domain-containing protein [Steroidobacteraceae bacterium]
MLETDQLTPRCRIAGLSVLVLLLAACSGAQVTSNSPTSASETANPTSVTLKVTGTPASSIAVGAAYSFQPVLSPVSSTVSFTIQGQPSWAQFDAATGALTGTPTASDEGQSSEVTITASEGGSTASIGPFAILVTAAPAAPPSGSATLSWQAPTSNVNGSPITGLAGYHIYYGTSPGDYTKTIDVAGAGTTTYIVTGLAAGTYYFAVNAYNASGVDSTDSNIATITI